MRVMLAQWYQRHFADPQAVILALMLLSGVLAVSLFGQILAPIIASMVLAYMLNALVAMQVRLGLPRWFAVWLTFLLFLSLVVVLTVALLPLVWSQFSELLLHKLPEMLLAGRRSLEALPQRYPEFVSSAQIDDLTRAFAAQLRTLGQFLVAGSVATLINLITLMIYLILVPLLVFFLLKDQALIRAWFVRYLPANLGLTRTVWRDMDQQIGNYLRGKLAEIMIVGLVAGVTFQTFGLDYAILLGFAVGLSVLVPYVGATLVTFPVAAIALFQWGWSSEFAYVMIAYGVIQALDGNLLVPLLFSEAVNLHPMAIVLAVLFFGDIWGVWGVFFAIPLATLVKSVLNVWPGLRKADPDDAPPQTLAGN